MPQEAILSHRLVLFLAANPTNAQPLRLDEEVRAIRQQLQRSVLTLDSCWAVRPLDMQQEILRLKPQFVHFSGHGIGQEPTFTPEKRTLIAVGANHLSDEEGLAFIEDATGRAALVDTEALASLFKNFQKYVKCVVLNGCYSEVQAEAIARYIPYVIGMKQSILDRAAIEFSKGFYNALAEGEAIESAFEFGKTAIELTGMPDYQFPVLHKPKETDAYSGLSPLKPDKFRNKRWVIAGCVVVSLLGATAIGLSSKLSQGLESEQDKCFRQAKEEGKLVVAIATFQHDASNQNTAAFIADQLRSRLESQTSIKPCSINKSVTAPSEAQNLGNKLGAVIVIWGRQNNSLMLEVKVTAVKKKVTYLTASLINAADKQDFNKQLKDLLPLVNVMTAYALLNNNHQDSKTRNVFENALEDAMRRKPDLNNQNTRAILSNAYSRLGDAYIPTLPDCLKDKESCAKAIKSYEKATMINNELYEAYISRGLLQGLLNKFEDAIYTYTQLINSAQDLDIILEARSSRARMFIGQKNFRGSMTDLQILCKHDPSDYKSLHKLGQSQLQVGQLLEAQNTYQRIKKLLKTDKTTLFDIIADLQLLAQLKLELRPSINLIIINLEQEVK